jgi:hypothetical protein
MMRFIKIGLFFTLILLLLQCTDKFDPGITQTGSGNGNISDTVYIQQKPVWSGFNHPEDMIIGKDGFLYICDTGNDRIVMMDIAGHVLGYSKTIKHPTSITQDYKKDLFVCARFDTLINSANVTYDAVYQIEMFPAGHVIANANVIRLLPRTSFDFSKPDRKFTGICAFYDNSIYVARQGNVNSGTSDPDNSIRVFRREGFKDNDRLPFIEPEGTGLISANGITSLTAFGNRSYDMLVTLVGNNSFKVQWLNYIGSGINEGKYNNRLDVSTDMMRIGKFAEPEDACIDRSNNIYIADAAKDSVFKFNSFGDELESFGGPDIFDSPHAVAHYDRTLYVLDTNNDRIVRFILSTETN